METNVEAYLPVTLSLFRLHARSIWYILTGRDGVRSLWSRDADHGKLCVSDILLERHPSISAEFPDQNTARKELEEGSGVGGGPAPSESDEDLSVEDDGPWYMGRAREEFNRRMRDAVAPSDDEDPVQVCNTCLLLCFSH